MTRWIELTDAFDPQFEAFVSQIEPLTNGCCWRWTGPKNRNGYGDFGGERYYLAHRYAFGVMRGDFAPRQHLHHVCERKDCVNPLHLQVMTASEHTRHHGVLKRFHASRKAKT